MTTALLIYPPFERAADPVGPMDPSQFSGRYDTVGIEGVGVVHVMTEIPADHPEHAVTRVVVQQHRDGEFLDPVPVTGSVSDSWFALSMHTHWCDTERLIRCLRGEREPLTLSDIDWGTDDADDAGDSSDDVDWRHHPGLTPDVQALIAQAFRQAAAEPDAGFRDGRESSAP